MSWVDICTWCCRNRNSINSQQAHHFPFVFCHRSRCGQKKVVAEPCSVCHDAVLSAVTRKDSQTHIHILFYLWLWVRTLSGVPPANQAGSSWAKIQVVGLIPAWARWKVAGTADLGTLSLPRLILWNTNLHESTTLQWDHHYWCSFSNRALFKPTDLYLKF